MKSRLIRIGNSRGVRLPKVLIDEACLEDEVEIRAEGRSIVISAASRTREGWAEDAAKAAAGSKHGLLDPPAATRFDREEWEW